MRERTWGENDPGSFGSGVVDIIGTGDSAELSRRTDEDESSILTSSIEFRPRSRSFRSRHYERGVVPLINRLSRGFLRLRRRQPGESSREDFQASADSLLARRCFGKNGRIDDDLTFRRRIGRS